MGNMGSGEGVGNMMELMQRWTLDGKTVSVYGGAGPVIYLPAGGQEMSALCQALIAAGCLPVTLAAVAGLEWGRDLTPWPAPAVYQKSGSFSGGAEDFLAQLTARIIPVVEQALAARPPWRGLAGYSLGGAFALWAAWQSSCFARVASVSGSLWYPGLVDALCACPPDGAMKRVYFSLGDRECRARNPALQTVQAQTERLCAHCRSLGVETVFRLHPGGHFHQPEQRMAAAIAWLAAAEPLP